MTTAYPQDGETEGEKTENEAWLRRVSGGSDVGGSPTTFYIDFTTGLACADSGNDRPINKSSI
jgi:hypothetical protein